MSRALRLAGVVALPGLAAGVVIAAARKLGDFDLPWHLALGRTLVTAHRLPMRDELSFTFAGQPAPGEFAADALLYVAARVGNGVGLQIVAALAIALLASLLVARARPAAPWPIAVAFAALGLMCAGPWFVVRPALLSFVWLAAFLLIVERDRQTGRGLWWLIPLELLWANLHGFAVLGPLFAAAYAGYRLACRLARGRVGALLPAPEGERAGRTAAIALGVGAVACASPLGPSLYLAPFAIGGYEPFLTEWTRTSLGFIARYDLALFVLGGALLAGLVRARPSAFDLGLGLVALTLALLAVRMIPLAAIVAAPLAARLLAPALERARGAAALVAIVGCLTAPVIASTPGLPLGRGFDHANLPEGAVRFLAAAHPSGAPWNFLPFGGWLAWRLHPDVRVFIDGRTSHLYPAAFFERYARAEHDAAAFAALAREYDLQWAVVRARPGEQFSEPLARDPRWTMVYLDDCAAVYVRKDGPNRALAERGYTLLRHLTTPPTAPVAPQFAEALRHDAALALAQAPDSARAHALAQAARYTPPGAR
jgi:hypothetical protein